MYWGWGHFLLTDHSHSAYLVSLPSLHPWIVPLHGVMRGLHPPCPPAPLPPQISGECGFNEIVPKLWIEPVHGIVPGHGFRIDWLGLWFDIAEGVSVQNLQVGGLTWGGPTLLREFWAPGPLVG